MKLPSVTEKLRGSRAAQSLEKLSRVSRRHQFLFQCGLILPYRLVLDFMYLTQLSPIYAYSGFTTDLVWIKYALSWLLVLVCLPLVVGLQGQEERPSSILVTLMNYVYFLPMTSYLGCKGSDLGFFCAVAVYWLVLLAVQLRMPTILVPKLPHRHTSLLFFLVSVGACLFVMGISGICTGFRLKLNLSDVYGIRAEAAAYDIPGLFAYVLSWMTVILSVLILYWLQKRRYVAVGVLVVVYLFYYSISAQKSVFLFLFLLLFCYLLYRKWMYRWCAGLLSLGVMGCWVLEAGAQFLTPMSLFVRRLMYVPVQLSEVYAQFFREHPLNLFRDGILGKLSYDPVYSIKIPKVIGEYMGTGSSANNGLVGDMYANLPVVLGVFLMPLILVILFRLLDAAARDIPQKIYIGLCVFFAMSFCNGSWSTVLLSGGFLMACIFLYLFPVQKEEHVKNEQS